MRGIKGVHSLSEVVCRGGGLEWDIELAFVEKVMMNTEGWREAYWDWNAAFNHSRLRLVDDYSCE